jgi:hypothetical protein
MCQVFFKTEKKGDRKRTTLKYIQIRKEVGFQLYWCDVRANYDFANGGTEFKTSF